MIIILITIIIIKCKYFEQGYWVLLQNCHLSIDYMGELVNTIVEMEAAHSDFQIWITTESHCMFCISLLQMSTKFACEPSQGNLIFRSHN